MKWNITIANSRVVKQIKNLPESVRSTLFLLVKDLEINGPTTSGRPTYVCCWEVTNKQLKIIEVYYAGTHEKAPY